MKTLAPSLAAALLAACSPPSPPAAPQAASAPEAPAAPAPAASVAAADVATAEPAADPAPSFDCAAAADESEKIVCADPALAALDRRLAAVYADALASPRADAAMIKAGQRGWIKGRADCWKADDKPACVREAYLTQIVQLQLDSGQVMVPSAVEYRCDEASKPFTVTFYNDLDPRAAVITWGSDQAIAFPRPAASGARYGREGLDFWEHQGEAKVDFYGNALTCTPVR